MDQIPVRLKFCFLALFYLGIFLALFLLSYLSFEKLGWDVNSSGLFATSFFLAILLSIVMIYWRGIYLSRFVAGPLLNFADKYLQIKLQEDTKQQAFNDFKKMHQESLARLNQELHKAIFEKKLQGTMLQVQRQALDKYAAVMETTAVGKITYVNQRFLNLSGYTHHEVLGKNPRFLNSDYHSREYFEKMWQTLLSGKVWLGEMKNHTKSGSDWWIQCSIAPVLGEDGTPYKFIAISIDITESKRMEELKDEFISAVSHEIRTPLTLIKASVNNLQDGIVGKLEEKQLKVLDIANRNCVRLGKIINDILDLSRLESHRSQANRQRSDVAFLLHENMAEFKKLAQEKHLEIKLQIPANLSEVYVDFDMILQVLSNLMQNAIRYAKSCIIIQARDIQQAVQISVVDDGPGIPKEHISKLFEKFVQINRPSGGAGYKGTGLGLAICKEIMNKHESHIWVDSVVGQGAQFHFLLPKFVEIPEQVIEKDEVHL